MNNNPGTIGVVIPAFNEADNLHRVLDAVCAVDWIEQIVVVDDGSTDGTFNVVEHYVNHDKRALAIHLPQNQGKAGAMLAGVRALGTDLAIFLDADLVGVKDIHLQTLYQPVMTGLSQMTVAVFRHGGLLTDASHYFAPNLSGQRCLWRQEAEEALMPLEHTRFGVETGLTLHAKRQNWRVQRIVWRGVTHRMKEQKRNMVVGVYSRWQMYRQIATVLTSSKTGRFPRRSRIAFFSRMSLH